MKSNKKTNVRRRLTGKEREELVKRLYEQGYTHREIARELRISVRDISRISRILRGEERKDEIEEIKERLSGLEEEVKRIKENIDDIYDTIDPIVEGINTAVTGGSVPIAVKEDMWLYTSNVEHVDTKHGGDGGRNNHVLGSTSSFK